MSRATIVLILTLTVSYPTTYAAGPVVAQQVGFGQVSDSDVDLLPEIYMPYTSGQIIPRGWKCVTIKVPVTETCIKTVCEEQIVNVPKQVPCTVCKQIQVPTEVYKTYITYKEVPVEDRFYERRSDAPEAELDELEREQKARTGKQVSRSGGGDKNHRVIAVSAPKRLTSNVQAEQEERSILQTERPQSALAPQVAYESVPVTKVRKKIIKIHVPVKRIVQVDAGCWQEITIVDPCACGTPKCTGGCRLLGGAKTTQKPAVRRVWEPRIVEREVTVLQLREVTIDETYTDYVQQPVAQPDAMPRTAPDQVLDPAPDQFPDAAPEDVMVTEIRPVMVPQYVTKAERHYFTKTIRVPSTKTIMVPVKQVIRREVPYEVRRIETREVLIPILPGVEVPRWQPQMPVGELQLPTPVPGNSTSHVRSGIVEPKLTTATK